jgi:hypothetical protein
MHIASPTFRRRIASDVHLHSACSMQMTRHGHKTQDPNDPHPKIRDHGSKTRYPIHDPRYKTPMAQGPPDRIRFACMPTWSIQMTTHGTTHTTRHMRSDPHSIQKSVRNQEEKMRKRHRTTRASHIPNALRNHCELLLHKPPQM